MGGSTHRASLLRARVLGTVLMAMGFFVLLAGPAEATVKEIGHCTAVGKGTPCFADGNVARPKSIFFKVTSQPPSRHVVGKWGTQCEKGTNEVFRVGSFSGRTPLKKTLTLPFKIPDKCYVRVAAHLDKSNGTIHVKIFATK